MKYKSFRIKNFKGIKDTTVNFDTIGGAAVFAFVGLNESGKTTVLEAIHSFSPDAATSELLGGEEGTGVPYKFRVPSRVLAKQRRFNVIPSRIWEMGAVLKSPSPQSPPSYPDGHLCRWVCAN